MRISLYLFLLPSSTPDEIIGDSAVETELLEFLLSACFSLSRSSICKSLNFLDNSHAPLSSPIPHLTKLVKH